MLGVRLQGASSEQLRKVVDAVDTAVWPPSPDAVLRVRAEEFEEVFAHILHQLGAGPPHVIISPLGEVLRRHQSDADGRELVHEVAEATLVFLGESVASIPDGGKIDPEPFLRDTHRKYGQLGLTIASEILKRPTRTSSRTPSCISEEWSGKTSENSMISSGQRASRPRTGSTSISASWTSLPPTSRR